MNRCDAGRRGMGLMAALLLCASVQTAAAGDPAVVVMLGDSTTLSANSRAGARLTDLVQARLGKARGLRKTVVVNSGKNGDTARGGYARLEEAVFAHRPGVVTVSFGLNDMGRLSPAEFREWLEKIIKDIRDRTSAKILLVTSTPFDNARHAWGQRFAEKGGLDEYMDTRFCEEVRDLAREFDLPLCDLHRHFKEDIAKKPGRLEILIRPDGVHLTEEGNRLAADHLAPMIAALLSAP